MKSMGILLSVLMLALAVPGGATEYVIVELPPLAPQEGTPTGAFDISENNGKVFVAGYSGSGTSLQAVRWIVSTAGASAPLSLGRLSRNSWSVAYGVNDLGNVVGSLQETQAFFWRNAPLGSTGLRAIPACRPGAKAVSAHAINNADEVVGFYSEVVPEIGVVLHPGWGFLWNSAWTGGVLRLDRGRTTLGSVANAISNPVPEQPRMIAGAAEVPPNEIVTAVQQAQRWEPDTVVFPGCLTNPVEDPLYLSGITLGALPIPEGPGSSMAYGINESGEAVGESNQFAVYFPGPVSLGVFGAARDINNPGQIVGYTALPAQYAFIHQNGSLENLNNLIPPNSGWSLLKAYGINDNGWIVGIGMKGVFSGPGAGTNASRSLTEHSEPVEDDPSSTVLRGFVLIPVTPVP
jgi:probable HAF family extracellular repeat protein